MSINLSKLGIVGSAIAVVGLNSGNGIDDLAKANFSKTSASSVGFDPLLGPTEKSISRVDSFLAPIGGIETDLNRHIDAIRQLNLRIAEIDKQLENSEQVTGSTQIRLEKLRDGLYRSKSDCENTIASSFELMVPSACQDILDTELKLRAELSDMWGMNQQKIDYAIAGWYVKGLASNNAPSGFVMTAAQVKDMDKAIADLSHCDSHPEIRDIGEKIKEQIKEIAMQQGPTISAARSSIWVEIKCRNYLAGLSSDTKELKRLIDLIVNGKPKGEIPTEKIIKSMVTKALIKKLVQDLIQQPLNPGMSYHSESGREHFEAIRDTIKFCAENERLKQKERDAAKRANEPKKSGGNAGDGTHGEGGRGPSGGRGGAGNGGAGSGGGNQGGGGLDCKPSNGGKVCM